MKMMNFVGALALVCFASSADAVSMDDKLTVKEKANKINVNQAKSAEPRRDKKPEATPCTKLIAEIKEEYKALDKTFKTMREEIAWSSLYYCYDEKFEYEKPDCLKFKEGKTDEDFKKAYNTEFVVNEI